MIAKFDNIGADIYEDDWYIDFWFCFHQFRNIGFAYQNWSIPGLVLAKLNSQIKHPVILTKLDVL